MDGSAEFTVCALLYGGTEYHHLHRRCLQSFQNLPSHCELRVALNSVTCVETRELLGQLADKLRGRLSLIDGENMPKYRRMRQLLEIQPVGRIVMWFDDDSYLDARVAQDPTEWLSRISTELVSCDMLGSIYRLRAWKPGQEQWIRAQPWFRGLPIPDQPSFITGGWWAARASLLVETGWPWPELSHNGGDVMLGVCMQQSGVKQRHFRESVRINADGDGRESAAKRRGLSEPPLGSGFSG